MRVALCVALALAASPAMASQIPAANKLFALVEAPGCDPVRITVPLENFLAGLVRDRRTTRVVVDWPVDSRRNIDFTGKPSPYLAALEVHASARALPELARTVRRRLLALCPARVYLVAERPLLRPVRSWPLGQPSPDAKIINTVVRKAGLAAPDFAREWTGVHAGLSLAWRSAANLANGRYVQNLVLAEAGAEAPAIDGIGEIEAQVPMNDGIRAGRLETARHALVFSDPARAAMFTAREIILKDR